MDLQFEMEAEIHAGSTSTRGPGYGRGESFPALRCKPLKRWHSSKNKRRYRTFLTHESKWTARLNALRTRVPGLASLAESAPLRGATARLPGAGKGGAPATRSVSVVTD